MVMKNPEATETEIREVVSFRRTTLTTYMGVSLQLTFYYYFYSNCDFWHLTP